MTHDTVVQYHRDAAQREEMAATHAATSAVGYIHNNLAEIHRREAAKIQSVHDAVIIAFGD